MPKPSRFLLSLFVSALLFTIFSLSSCVKGDKEFRAIAPGIWRGVISLQNEELPFNFEMFNNDPEGKKISLVIHNGTERIEVKDISFIGRDSMLIDFPHYETYLKVRYNPVAMEGQWISTVGKGFELTFKAETNQRFRFKDEGKKAEANFGGRWAVAFDADKEKPEPAIGEFVQNGNQLLGTFLTETGDYRFLEGIVKGKKAYLSCFDGSHAFLFQMKMDEAEKINGAFWSGATYRSVFTAERNEAIRLAHPDSLTAAKTNAPVSFSFPNTEGKLISLNDEAYQGKVKIVQVLGTWCPNCADETAFLAEFYKSYPQQNELAIIGLAFEKHKELEKAAHAVNIYKRRFAVNWEVLIAGERDKEKAAEALPMLESVKAYPTMIILDRSNKIRKIHTGFSGPATSEYAAFSASFKEFIGQLVAEK